MEGSSNGLSPGGSDDCASRLRQVIDFWNGFSCLKDAGETTWGVLEELQTQVSDCLSRDPVDLEKAEAFTALAALLPSGRIIF